MADKKMEKEETKVLYEIILILNEEKTSELITCESENALIKFDELMDMIDKITAKGGTASVQFWKYRFLKRTKCKMLAHYEGGKNKQY